MNGNLTLEEFVQTTHDSVKKLFTTTMRILNVFVNTAHHRWHARKAPSKVHRGMESHSMEHSCRMQSLDTLR